MSTFDPTKPITVKAVPKGLDGNDGVVNTPKFTLKEKATGSPIDFTQVDAMTIQFSTAVEYDLTFSGANSLGTQLAAELDELPANPVTSVTLEATQS